MKKKYLIISINILLVLTICLYVLISDNAKRFVINNNDSKPLINTNSLTMMYETEYQSGEYQTSNDTTWPKDGYKYNSELSKCENGSTLTWDDENKKVVMQASTSDKCYVYFDVYDPIFLTDYIINNVYTGVDGENNLYYHDVDLANGAEDNSYRYTGANPNNYVCFKINEGSCSEDNLYRIVGIYYNQETQEYNVKLKAEYAYEFNFYSNYQNSLLDLINNTLNNEYLTEISNISDKISNYSWHLNEISLQLNAKQIYDTEFNNYEDNKLTQKIGLTYASDVLYADLPNIWTNSGNYNKTLTTSNWLIVDYIKNSIGESNEALMDFSTARNDILTIYSLNGSSMITDTDSGVSPDYAYPVFYLNSNVEYISGNGSLSNPYIIN